MDIVERIHSDLPPEAYDSWVAVAVALRNLADDAAAEIERLRAALEVAREALEKIDPCYQVDAHNKVYTALKPLPESTSNTK